MKTEWLIFSYPLRSCAICTFLHTTVFDHSLACSSVGTTILAESPVQYISVERQLTYIKPCLRGGILFSGSMPKKVQKITSGFFSKRLRIFWKEHSDRRRWWRWWPRMLLRKLRAVLREISVKASQSWRVLLPRNSISQNIFCLEMVDQPEETHVFF